MEISVHGLYIVKDSYFADFPSEHWMWNKAESRPQYLAIQDASGLLWLIPLSSKVENYRAKIARVEERRGEGNCVYYHIGKIAGKERAFIISGMFPITECYISHQYTISSVPYIVRDKELIRQLHSKAQRYLRLLEQGQLRDENHVLDIRTKLLQK